MIDYMYRITDIRTGRQVTVDDVEIYDELVEWYPDAPTETYEAIRSLQEGIMHRYDTSAARAHLGITVKRVRS